MTENMKAFMDAIENNEELKVKFDEISNKEQAEQKDYTDEYIALAKECGITLTDEDFELDEEELSDEDLENVSGGVFAPQKDLLEKWQEEHKAEIAKRRAQKESQSTAGTTTESQDQN